MVTSNEVFSPEREAFENLAFEVLAELTQIHGQQFPHLENSVFLAKFKTYCDDPAINGDAAIEQIERALNDGVKADYYFTALTVSSVYLAQARQAADRECAGEAWYALAKACYWCGVMRSLQDKSDWTLSAVEKIRAAESAPGGRKRAASYAPARATIVELAEFLKPGNRGWTSLREAALAIQGHVLDLDPENPIAKKLAVLKQSGWEDYFTRTLREDLRDEQFECLFPGLDRIRK